MITAATIIRELFNMDMILKYLKKNCYIKHITMHQKSMI